MTIMYFLLKTEPKVKPKIDSKKDFLNLTDQNLQPINSKKQAKKYSNYAINLVSTQ